jgi:hypothetical protein
MVGVIRSYIGRINPRPLKNVPQEKSIFSGRFLRPAAGCLPLFCKRPWFTVFPFVLKTDADRAAAPGTGREDHILCLPVVQIFKRPTYRVPGIFGKFLRTPGA